MIDAGDIYLADLNEERRRQEMVISTGRSHQWSGRALVAPQINGPSLDVSYPWHVQVDGVEFAIDAVRTIQLDRLLDRIDRAPASVNLAVRRVIQSITEG